MEKSKRKWWALRAMYKMKKENRKLVNEKSVRSLTPVTLSVLSLSLRHLQKLVYKLTNSISLFLIPVNFSILSVVFSHLLPLPPQLIYFVRITKQKKKRKRRRRRKKSTQEHEGLIFFIILIHIRSSTKILIPSKCHEFFIHIDVMESWNEKWEPETEKKPKENTKKKKKYEKKKNSCRIQMNAR